MEFLGIGPLELMFIVLLILLVFGPKDIARMARSIGQFLNRLYRSENYKIIQKTS
ncbi:MAG: Twin-arginine translocase TatA/TatE family subunit, partial [Anaerolineales bacterium]|nr:Twin-arginine translocase TatA/TatE family subunit [Anaerolineales bacterium]